jgi:hypothetical protein
MRNEEFIQSRLIDESQKLLSAKFYFPAFMTATQGIESLGAFLDKKPLSAKYQSKKRFHLAIQKLFKEDYQPLVLDQWLYQQLRCNMSHLSHSGGFIKLCVRNETRCRHLTLEKGLRIFIVEEFIADFHFACIKTKRLLVGGEIPQKKMSLRQI